jgi:hypothetical protein
VDIDESPSASAGRPKRYDVLAGTELARAPRRLLLAWESGSLVARFNLSAADRPKRESQCRQCGRIRLPLRRRIVGLPRIAASSCGCELAAGRSARSSISIDRALWCHRFTSRSDQWSAARTPGTGFRTGASRTTGARAKGSRWSWHGDRADGCTVVRRDQPGAHTSARTRRIGGRPVAYGRRRRLPTRLGRCALPSRDGSGSLGRGAQALKRSS